MAIKKREGEVNISLESERSTFSALFHLFSKEDLFSEISIVRSLLSNEKAKILHAIKEKKPVSIYILAKHLGRDFKAVRKDIKTLEHFGIIKLVKSEKGKRKGLMPVLNLDSLKINIEF
jgi:predicted transcriptional regulator